MVCSGRLQIVPGAARLASGLDLDAVRYFGDGLGGEQVVRPINILGGTDTAQDRVA